MTVQLADPPGEALGALHHAHRRLSAVQPQDGLVAASVAAVECAVHLVRATGRVLDPASDPVAEARDALAAARAAVTAAAFAVRSLTDDRRVAWPAAGNGAGR